MLRRMALASAAVWLVACGGGNTPSPSARAVSTPTPDPRSLLSVYVRTLTADVNALPADVGDACAGGVEACGRALDAAGAVAQKAIADMQALPAEPQRVMSVVEDIRSELRFTLGLGGNVRSGQNSPADDADSYASIHHQLVSDLGVLTSQAAG